VAAQLVASRVVLSSTELVSYNLNYATTLGVQMSRKVTSWGMRTKKKKVGYHTLKNRGHGSKTGLTTQRALGDAVVFVAKTVPVRNRSCLLHFILASAANVF
jgi:hypothetical protein